MNDSLIIVDPDDNELGSIEKMKAHEEGILHRAFSVFVFDSNLNWLLQKRAITKYHSGGKWSNACCGHPAPGARTEDAAKSRLKDEMGLSCLLQKIFDFTYKAQVGQLTEHEFDHVYFAFTDDRPVLNPLEADEWKLISFEDLDRDLQSNPENYTEWFKIIYKDVYKRISKLNLK